MKKKILGLLLALCLIIGMLPMTTLAASTEPAEWACVRIVQAGIDCYLYGSNAGRIDYAKTVDGKVITEGASESDYNIKIAMEDSVLKITLKDAYFYCDSQNNHIMTVGYAARDINEVDTTNYSVEVTLIGENKIENTAGQRLLINKNNGTTFTGPGSFYMEGNNTCVIWYKGGDLTIKDTTFTVVQNGAWRQHCLQMVGGNLIIENSTVDLIDMCGAAAVYFGDFDALDQSTSRGLYIKGSDVNIENQYQAGVGCYHQPVIACKGPFVIEDSNVTISNGCWCKFAYKAPEIKGSVSAFYKSQTDQDYVPFDVEAGTLFDGNGCASGADYAFLKVTHTHVAAADDGDCTTAAKCACGFVMAAAQAAHTPAADDKDCTTATLCANEGCTQVCERAPATEHVPGEDDGDCTTAVKCTNPGCEQDAIPATEHVGEDGEFDCTVAHPCKNCDKNFREAGEHFGGTATCKEKATCESCGEVYGELGACTPAADDGDCTTAVKCSVCGEEVTAAKTHAYTDNADASCNNAGCTHTRTIEGSGTNGNPQTGDVVLTLFVVLMMASAAAFVFTKKKIA